MSIRTHCPPASPSQAPLNLMAVLAALGCAALLYCVGGLRVAMGATVAIMALNE